MQINVYIDNKLQTMHMHPRAKIQDIVQYLSVCTGQNQSLYWNGEILDESKRLNDYNLNSDDHLVWDKVQNLDVASTEQKRSDYIDWNKMYVQGNLGLQQSVVRENLNDSTESRSFDEKKEI